MVCDDGVIHNVDTYHTYTMIIIIRMLKHYLCVACTCIHEYMVDITQLFGNEIHMWCVYMYPRVYDDNN